MLIAAWGCESLNVGTFSCLLLAHFISDFPLQFKKLLKLRNNTCWKTCLLGNIAHAGIHFAVSVILTAYFQSLGIIVAVAIISILHAFIDLMKSLIISKYPFSRYSPGVFLFDQLLHLLIIFFTLYLTNTDPLELPSVKTMWSSIVQFSKYSVLNAAYGERVVLSLVFLTVGLWGVGVFIRIFFANMAFKPYKKAINLKIEIISYSENYGAADGGFIIGILERLFIITSIVLNMSSVIGFILGAKSIARLKKFDDDRFVEMFIIGSFISFICAIATGYTIKALLKC